MKYIEKLNNVEKEAGVELKETKKIVFNTSYDLDVINYFAKDDQNRITGASVYLTDKKLNYTKGKVSKTEKNKVEGKRNVPDINDEHVCHIISKRFEGEHKSDNLFYGSRKLNNSMERIEAFIHAHLSDFKNDIMYYAVRLVYVADERRVDSIEITFISCDNSDYPRMACIRN